MSEPKTPPGGESPTRAFQIKLDNWMADLSKDLGVEPPTEAPAAAKAEKPQAPPATAPPASDEEADDESPKP